MNHQSDWMVNPLMNSHQSWVQVAGHEDTFTCSGRKTIWKKLRANDNNESLAYQAMTLEGLQDIIPKFHREVQYKTDTFIEIEDLLQHFTEPNIMDIKMGTRTFLEADVINPVQKKSLYEKMIQLDPTEPTQEEHNLQAAAKFRYNMLREKCSTSSTLGFRIDGIKMNGEETKTSRDLQYVHSKKEVEKLFGHFLNGNRNIQNQLLGKLFNIQQKLEASEFMRTHEILGSSILIIHDRLNHVGAWIIDLGKARLAEGQSLTHRKPWQLGNHEDGYLTGLDNVIQMLSDVDVKDHCPSSVSTSSASSQSDSMYDSPQHYSTPDDSSPHESSPACSDDSLKCNSLHSEPSHCDSQPCQMLQDDSPSKDSLILLDDNDSSQTDSSSSGGRR